MTHPDQPDFFIPAVYDVPIKDEVSLMDISPFNLSKNKRLEPIKYDLGDSKITISGNTEHGIATVHDYDIVLHMVSQLANDWNKRKKKYKDPKNLFNNLPPRKYRPPVHDILQFCGRGDGGDQFKKILEALERLKTTYIKIETTSFSKKRPTLDFNDKGEIITKGFSYINDFTITAKSKKGTVTEVEIEIPDWIYQGIVKTGKEETPSILTLDKDYFKIKKSLEKALYRFARQRAGKTDAKIPLLNLHKQSGMKTPIRMFKSMIKTILAENEGKILNYDVIIKEGRANTVIEFTNCSKADCE